MIRRCVIVFVLLLVLVIELRIGMLVYFFDLNDEIRMSNDEFLGFNHGSRG
jgi:hypothetical protein